MLSLSIPTARVLWGFLSNLNSKQMSLINTILGTALLYGSLPLISVEDRKKELRQQWRDSTLLPRKKKKARRKEIMVDWKIACWMEQTFSFNLNL
jgi:hypothetical protein